MEILSLLLLQILFSNSGLAEWIDMPQFSDRNKVYRISSEQQDHFYKFSQKNVESQFPPSYLNISYDEAKSGIKVFTEEQIETEDIIVTSTEEYTTDSEISENVEDNEYQWHANDSSFANGAELLNYLPVDILKSVHNTLMSQPASSEGKIQFLKSFENSLITEIESRLSDCTSVDREKRGADHYEYNDHDHSAGFPSIEGALMAISFLTFAVYLIRLVMLLFRNMNNNMTTTTGATVFLGRRKRSIDRLEEDIAMILQGLDSFTSKL